MKLRIGRDQVERLARLAAKPPVMAGRLLVVDDEPENLTTIVRLLEGRYEVVAASDPAEALRIAESQRFDVVITDQRMPGMLGTELLARIKEVDSDNVRMILTGYTDVKDLVTCINDGLISRYLVKPWRAVELEAVVEQGIAQVTLQRTMRKLIPHQVLDRLYGGRLQEAKPGEGRELDCAALFLDIRGFTGLSERLDPRGAFQLLTSYLSAVAPAIGRHHGFVDKYLGDGLLAIFDREGGYGEDALACALELVRATEAYNATELPAGVAPLSIGIGVCAGRVMLGTVGFADRLEFTVLGDAVNTAHRIQELTKQHGCTILVEDALLAGRATSARALGAVPVRGKDRPVVLHVLV